MPRIRKMEIVSEGIQSNGKRVTTAMLESVVRNYNPDSRPPITLGHPKKGDDQIAALGRVGNLRTEVNAKGKTALVGEMVYTPELEELEDTGKFEGQSAGIHPIQGKEGEYRLHHLAQLGQLPPAGDIKTKDVVQLSDDDFGEDVIYLSAHVGSATEEESEPMKFEQLMALIDGCNDEQKKQLSEKLNITPAAAPKPKDDNLELKKSGETDGEQDKALDALRGTIASDRKDVLNGLLKDESRDINDGQKKILQQTIDGASTVELCDDGDTSIFKTTKAMIESFPAKAEGKSSGSADDEWSDLLNGVELSDDGKPKEDKPFDMEGF